MAKKKDTKKKEVKKGIKPLTKKTKLKHENMFKGNLSEEQLVDFHKFLLDDDFPDTRIRAVIQEEWGLLTDNSLQYIRRAISYYKCDYLNSLPYLSKEDKGGIQVPAILKKMDTLNGLADLCTMQRTRVQKIYAKEKPSPLLMSQVSSEIKMFGDLLEKLAKLQMNTGILPTAPKVYNGAVSVDNESKEMVFRVTEETHEAIETLEADFKYIPD